MGRQAELPRAYRELGEQKKNEHQRTILRSFSVMDGVHRRIADAADSALRTHVTSFHGPSFVAERGRQDLRAHVLHDEHGRPVQENALHHQEGSSGTRSSAGAATASAASPELNSRKAAAWSGVGP
jgi:hypothetical protein